MNEAEFPPQTLPASRLFLFRTAVAVTTLFYIPRFGLELQNTIRSSFHVPMLTGIPFLTPAAGYALILLECFAALFLFAGLFPRISAAFLLASELYIFLIDVRHYTHFSQFHMILLAVLAMVKIPFSWLDLYQKNPRETACSDGPAYFLRWQIAIIFFYSALEKVFSPFWGLSGSFFIHELNVKIEGSGIFFEIWKQARLACVRFPSIASAAAIFSEFFIAASLLLNPLRKAGAAFGFLFILIMEFLIKPSLFTWDLTASFFLFLPLNKNKSILFTLLAFTIMAGLRFWKGSFLAMIRL